MFVTGLCGLAATQAQEKIPRPEHPRPDFQRELWMSLNGQWEFDIDRNGDISTADVKPHMKLTQIITVPFCPESKLSGIGHTDFMKHVMYRRRFVLPDEMKEKRLILHFGAVDWEATVWLNGRLLGSHKGGYTPFWFDITEHIKGGENEIFLSVRDDTASGLQARGKQSNKRESYGCHYTRTTGIWQTVWIEAVGKTWIRECSLLPDLDGGRLIFQGWVAGPCSDVTVRLKAFAQGKVVATDEVPAAWRSTLAVLNIPEPQPWGPASPFLYGLTISLVSNGTILDEVTTYFGLRKVHIEGNRILINNKPIFQRLVLDQGYYSDGIYTAPSDDALRRDIELSMAAGFNGARLHQKVFEPRLLYWADKLGYLLWGEFADWGVNMDKPEALDQMVIEWQEVLKRDRNHPSIIGWCPLNETRSTEAIQRAQHLLSVTQIIDPSRPFLDTSGYCHLYSGADVYDSHNYNQDPDTFRAQFATFAVTGAMPFEKKPGLQNPYAGQPYFVSEYGGIHIKARQPGGEAWGYGKSAEDIDDFLTRYRDLTDVLMSNPNMFGFCYTQLTDIEQEQNGVYYYDRSQKFDAARLRQINQQPAAYEKQPPSLKKLKTNIVLQTSRSQPQIWRYTTDQPSEGWFLPLFDGSAWKKGKGGFGTQGTPGAVIGTRWNTSDIWLRKEFDVEDPAYDIAWLVIHHDEDANVYLNGKPVADLRDFTTGYVTTDITEKLRGVLKKGTNVVAIHCHQTRGGQFIDLGIALVRIIQAGD